MKQEEVLHLFLNKYYHYRIILINFSQTMLKILSTIVKIMSPQLFKLDLKLINNSKNF